MLRREACITLRASSCSRWWPHRLAVLSRRQLSALTAVPQHAVRTRSYASSAANSQDTSSGSPPLGWQQLHRAAQVAYWSGLCYLRDGAQLSEALQQQRLTLVAHGRNEYTSWFIADGAIPHDAFCSIYSSRQKLNSSGGSSSRNSGSQHTNSSSSNGHTGYVGPEQKAAAEPNSEASSSTANNYRRYRLNTTPTDTLDRTNSNGPDGSSSSSASHGRAGTVSGGSPSAPTTSPAAAAAAAAAGGGSHEVGGTCGLEVPPPQRERFVFFRGVQWAAPEVNSLRMGQVLAALWPAPFAADLTTPRGTLVAHSGVSQVAADLFDQLRPYLDQGADAGLPLCFAGHSLGGSLGTLVMGHHALASRRRRSSMAMNCYTFGSPPVLAHAEGGGGHHVMGLLGLPPSALRNFALENDPVPRALLSVDPTYQVLQQWDAVRGLLQLRERLVGAGAPLSPGRFLYEAVGEVHLIKWTPAAGTQVVPLNSREMLHELGMLGLAPDGTRSSSGSPSPETGAPSPAATPTASSSTTPSSSDSAEQQGLSPAGVLSWLAAAAPDLTPRWPWQPPGSTTPNAAASNASNSSAPAPASPTPSSSSHPQGHVGVGVNRLTDKAPPGPGNPAAAGVAALLSPWRSLQAWLDHHHGSYAQELETAALKQMKAQLRAQQLAPTGGAPQQQQQQQQQHQQQHQAVQPQQWHSHAGPDVGAGRRQHHPPGQPHSPQAGQQQDGTSAHASSTLGGVAWGPVQRDSGGAGPQQTVRSAAGGAGGVRGSAVAISST